MTEPTTPTPERLVERWCLREELEQTEQMYLAAARRADRYRTAWHSARTRAARATGTLDGVQANLALLHQGEEPHPDQHTVPTPGQWIWHWNRATPSKRLEVAAKALADADHRYENAMNHWPERARQAEAEIITTRAALDEVARDLNMTWLKNDITAEHVVRRVRAAMDGATPVQERPSHADQNARSMLLNLLAGWGMRSGHGARAIVDEALRRHTDEVALAAGAPLICSDERHQAKVAALEARIVSLQAECDGLAEVGRNESRIWAAGAAAVRTLHRPVQHLGITICDECSTKVSTGIREADWERRAVMPWPCATIEALDGPAGTPVQPFALPVDVFGALVRIARHVSAGRDAVGAQELYPDVAARWALGRLDDVGLLARLDGHDCPEGEPCPAHDEIAAAPQQIVTLPPQMVRPGPMLVQPCATESLLAVRDPDLG
ncbi:hypothetical protein OG689_10675 [Kitasatospora sp. NBC_00240]|uniref:hypothetical protein n=1 Tax=Kitasatospora sp. NBC_00240 TaxID=2903567 RepID=UPI00224D73C7|nr:hypothetical protein [Kitasatospora sp. NBC_00240]MCX5209747.1 hypothetical protein [Kitasatospora sp. NBC_00240]